MSATRTWNTPLARILSADAKKAHIFDVLQSASLISLCQLCDVECITILNNNEVNILKDLVQSKTSNFSTRTLI